MLRAKPPTRVNQSRHHEERAGCILVAMQKQKTITPRETPHIPANEHVNEWQLRSNSVSASQVIEASTTWLTNRLVHINVLDEVARLL